MREPTLPPAGMQKPEPPPAPPRRIIKLTNEATRATAEKFASDIADIIEHFHGRDPEGFHSDADKCMEKLLIELGYGEGIELMRKQTRW